MNRFEIVSFPESALFDTEQELYILAERNTLLTIKRNLRTRKLRIGDAVFKNNSFTIGNNCVVCKLLLSANKDERNNLEIRISNVANEKDIVNEYLDFNTVQSLVEILKDSVELQKIEALDKEKRADKIAELLKLSESVKTKYADQLNEDLKCFFDLRKFGELQSEEIEKWNEDENIENELYYIENELYYMENKIKGIIKQRESLPLHEIQNKIKEYE